MTRLSSIKSFNLTEKIYFGMFEDNYINSSVVMENNSKTTITTYLLPGQNRNELVPFFGLESHKPTKELIAEANHVIK